jgi:predicted Zn-dependent protease
MLESLEKMLTKGVDNPLLRFGLGKGYLDANTPEPAVEHLRQCVIQDPSYSAAWKLLGKALDATGQFEAAQKAWLDGIAAAQVKGDKQAEKEMTVFLRKLEKKTAPKA